MVCCVYGIVMVMVGDAMVALLFAALGGYLGGEGGEGV
jgi:hypothetical protein